MKYQEENGDLFALKAEDFGGNLSYAQCISADFAMGAGVAVLFNKYFDIKNALKKDFGSFLMYWDRQENKGWCLYRNHTFNMITKRNHWDKPTLTAIRNAMERMKEMCISMNVKNLAMPKIACGIDGQDWEVISPMIQDVFKDTDINIIVRYI